MEVMFGRASLVEGVQNAANVYEKLLIDFLRTKGGLELLVTHPVDHVAAKAQDTDQFEAWLVAAQAEANELSYIEMDGRRLATARLPEPIKLGAVGESVWLELMEPRPGKAGQSPNGLEHIEVRYKDFKYLSKRLPELGIDYQPESNPGHSWLTVVLNDASQELKFTDGYLGEIVARQTAAGESTVLK